MRKRLVRAGGALAAVVLLGGCLSATAAFADDSADVSLQLPESWQSGLHTDYQADSSGVSLQNASALPSALDLRHYNGTVTYNEGDSQSTITGGTNYVTPVKKQNPFGTCWAFSITAASETSMLTALDKADDGEMNGSVNYDDAIAGKCGSLAYCAANLSERHLAFFSYFHCITNGLYPSQAGEGKYVIDGSTTDSVVMNSGGMPLLGMSTYSSGIGPVPESVAPYISEEGWIRVPKTQLNSAGNDLLYAYFTSYDKAKAYSDATWTDEVIAAFNEENGTHLTKLSVQPSLAEIGTWSLAQSEAFGIVAELDNSNMLASDKDEETGALTDDEIAQMKEELVEGHAISIAYTADQSRPSDSITGTNSYMNTATWAQYTYDSARVNHAVTVVGYDDNYAASNFTHTVYKQDEDDNWVVDEENSAKTTPAGNGAWIVKNSWGSTDTDNVLYQTEWGVKDAEGNNTGYFYLSYYDKNISNMETYEYDTSAEAQARSELEIYQYDLANVNSTRSVGTDEVCETCNVFDGPEEGETYSAVRDLGCLTGSPNATVTLDVYVMDDSADATQVIDAQSPTVTVTESFDTAGFHRLHLDSCAYVGPDQKFAVVQTTKRTNGTYEYTYGYAVSKDCADAYNTATAALGQTAVNNYVYTVVNEGESLYKDEGGWQDWSDKIPALDQKHLQEDKASLKQAAETYRALAKAATNPNMKAIYEAVAEGLDNFNPDTDVAIDNFSIKAYADAVDELTFISQPASYTGKLNSKASFTAEASGAEGITYKWEYSADGGKTWKASSLTGSTVSVKLTAKSDGRMYRCVATDESGNSVTSEAAAMSVAELSITSQPADYTGALNSKATFAVEAAGTGELAYRWQYSADGGKTWKSSALTSASITAKLTAKSDGRMYRCIVSDAYGNRVVSDAATMSIENIE